MAERSLECGECRRAVAIHYTEIAGGVVNEFLACAQCPVVARRLYGGVPPAEGAPTLGAGLCCGNCGTTLEDVQIGHDLGCSNCYEVFADIIVQDLMTSQKVSKRLASTAKKKSMPLHIGRSPGESAAISPTARLTALHEALKETLAREDYEQAAWLRDQIKRFTEEPHDGQQQKGPDTPA